MASLNDLGDLIGVSHSAIRKAAKEGRLTAGVIVRGKSVTVTDADAAAAQWASTHDGAGELPDGVPPIEVSKARREAALAELAEIDVAERRGELISVEEARADVIDKFAIVRTRLLGIPARVAQRLPRLAGEVVPVLEGLLCEALEEPPPKLSLSEWADEHFYLSAESAAEPGGGGRCRTSAASSTRSPTPRSSG
jgi:phage terminase Nu1 subunit (DNA packaging protein)